METIKVIDIANKIESGGLKLPILLKVKNNPKNIFIHIYESKKAYWEDEDGRIGCIVTFDDLFREVEIIEEIEKPKKIDKLEIVQSSPTCYCLRDEKDTICSLNKHTRIITNKLNEVIDKLNHLLEKRDKDE